VAREYWSLHKFFLQRPEYGSLLFAICGDSQHFVHELRY